MSKTQRELLMLAGILVFLGGILYIRLSGGGESSRPSTMPAPGSRTQTASRPVGTAPGTMTPGGEGLQSQSALAFFEPGLTDSAVTARIFSSSVGNPFARYRGGQTRPTRPSTRPQRQQPATPLTRRVEYLDDWPPQITYQGVFPVADSPGVFRARFNGRNVQVGEKIAPTEYVLVEASPLLVQIRWEDRRRNTIWIFRYLRQQPVPDL